MRTLMASTIVGAALLLAGGTARAQVPGVLRGPESYFSAPGNWGMAYGVPSNMVPRTYSTFNSPYGAGYGYGYPPFTYAVGRYGVGLWRPGFAAPGYYYQTSYYTTFPFPFRPVPYGYGPPVGAYAPAYGPPAFMSQ